VEKADRAMHSVYSDPTGHPLIFNSGFLNVTTNAFDETSSFPTLDARNDRIYVPGRTDVSFTTSDVTLDPTWLGVDQGTTPSTLSWTISTQDSAGAITSTAAWPRSVSVNDDGTQDIEWVTAARAWQDFGRAAAVAGDSLRDLGGAFRQVGNAVGQASNSIPFRIVVNPNLPPDQITWTYGQDYVIDGLESPRSRYRRQMQPRRDPCRADQVSFQNCSPAEITALTLLKKMVDGDGWRKYLKYGFVNVKGQSGLTYQIRRGQWHVLVWNPQGTKVAELCVGLSQRASMPPTDEVIARMIMAECDEPELWRRANVDTEATGKHALYSVNGRPAWTRHHAGPENVKVLERLSAAA